jgi:uncharacterized membrane protein SpoIIM required for sporulation
MKAEEFVASRQVNWKQLSDLLNSAERSLGHLSPEQITRLGQLYRATTSDLAYAQREFPRHRAATYLNQLVGRGHAVIYRSEPLAFKRMWHFVTTGFPRAFREMLPFFLVSAGLFLIPAVLVGIAVYLRPEIAPAALPAGADQMIEMIENKELWTNIPVTERPFMSSAIMTNNIQVAFLAFGGGMLAGLLTIWVLVSNGLMLGAISGLTFHYGVGWDLWEFVIGHGVIELSVIMIAGGTGLMIGWAMLHPGLMRRSDALADAGKRTVRVLIGCIPLLMIAGTIEGFISPNEFIPAPVKWMIGISSGILLYSYLLLAGRGEDPLEVTENA